MFFTLFLLKTEFFLKFRQSSARTCVDFKRTRLNLRRSSHKYGEPCLGCSVADPYHFDMDPDLDPGCEKICYRHGNGFMTHFDTDLDPGKTETDPDLGKKI